MATQTASGLLFTVGSVSIDPATPRLKESVTVSGTVKLFGIPYIGPVWVIASVTYPKEFWEVIQGSPVQHQGGMALGGKFNIQFPQGFDRSGNYTLDVRVYAGPTVDTSTPLVKTITVPPLPAVATWPQQTFTVTGTIPPITDQYRIGKPVVSPGTIIQGTPVTITVPVTSQALTEETIVVELKVDYGSILSGPGSTISTADSQPISIKPGETKNFAFNYTEVAPADGRRDTEVTVLVNGVSKGYDHQNDLWTAQTTTVGFTLGQPTANPGSVAPGQQVTITCPVTNKSSQAQFVTILVEVKQAGFAWLAGPTTDSKTFDTTIQPGATYNAVMQHTASLGGPTDSSGQAMRHVAVTLKVGGQLATNTAPTNPNEFDNVFGVTTSASVVAFTLEQPSATPSSVNVGQTVAITCPVFNRSTSAQIVTVLVEVKQAGFAYLAGPTIDSKTFSATIQPGDTYNPVMQHVASSGGPANSSGVMMRHVAVTLKVGGQLALNTAPTNPNEFDNVFGVATTTSGGGGGGGSSTPGATLTGIVVNPPQAAPGSIVTVSATFNYSGPATVVSVAVGIGEKSWFGGAFTTDVQQSKSFSLPASSGGSITKDVSVMLPQSLATKLYDIATRVLDSSGNELANRIDSGELTVAAGGASGGLVGFFVTADYTGITAEGWDRWLCAYYDPQLQEFVWETGGAGWKALYDQFNFSNVPPGGYVIFYLMNSETGAVHGEIDTARFNQVDGRTYTVFEDGSYQ